VVIGGGPGGYSAAIRSAQLKAEVLLIEKEKLGGICNNAGCIPTKTLIETAKFLSLMKKSKNFGISCGDTNVSFKRVMEATNKIVERERKGLQYLIKANKIEVVKGIGRIFSPEQVEIRSLNGQTRIVECKKIIVATGSVPSEISIPGLDENKILTPEDIVGLKEKPRSLLITGFSEWGIELAFIYKALGSEVIYAQPTHNLLPKLDEMFSNQMQKILNKKGIETLMDARLKEARDGKISVETTSEVREVEAQLVLNTKRKPSKEGLGLEKIGVESCMDKIKVNNHMETNVPNIYAVGDVTGGHSAHVALAEGLVAAENAVGDCRETINRKAVPKVLFTIPQIATVGLTEREAEKEGYTIKVGKFPFIASGRAITLRQKEGLVKVLADAELGEILGVHVLGPQATEMIAEACLAINLEATVEDVIRTIHAHPTLSEVLKEAFLDVEGKALHNA
jgi:dihydrolipoamide dehydrogenase